MDDSVENEEELPPEIAAKLQLWEAVCRNTAIVKDAEYDQILQQIESAKKTGETGDLEAGIHLAIEYLTDELGIKPPAQPVGELNEERWLDLRVYSAEMQTSELYRGYLDSELAALNMRSIQLGHGPLPGCDEIGDQEYICSIDADAPAYTYSPNAITSDAMWHESQSVLRSSQNKPLFDAAKDALVREVLNGNVAVPGTQDPSICRAYAVLNESGILPELEKASIRFEEPIKQGVTIDASDSTMKGRGHMLDMRDGHLRLLFTGDSEEEYPQWPALVAAYNMKHPQQEPLEFMREKDGSYAVKADADTLRELSEHMHRGLIGLKQVPEMSVPNTAIAEQENTRER